MLGGVTGIMTVPTRVMKTRNSVAPFRVNKDSSDVKTQGKFLLQGKLESRIYTSRKWFLSSFKITFISFHLSSEIKVRS